MHSDLNKSEATKPQTNAELATLENKYLKLISDPVPAERSNSSCTANEKSNPIQQLARNLCSTKSRAPYFFTPAFCFPLPYSHRTSGTNCVGVNVSFSERTLLSQCV